MKIKKIIAAGLSATIFILQSAAFAERAEDYGYGYQAAELVADYAAQLYIDEETNPDELIKAGISKMLEEDPEKLVPFLKTMISTLDPYSEYFTLEEYQGFLNEVNKSFYGIGVIIQKNGDYVEVMGFTKDSPSQNAGIMIGDKIAKVNGTDMYAKNMNEVRSAIMGEVGTQVTVTVLRDGELFDFSITRSMVNETTVTCDKISDDIAYIQITDMSLNTAEEFKEALAQADEWGIKKIVLDLRNNGGGYLTSSIDIAKQIVPAGLIVKTEYRESVQNKDYYSELSDSKYEFNVLVNEYTASAAEILASALQDSGAGRLIGKQTYGKAVIQQTFKLINNSYLKLTVGHYITRNGNEINGIGITPDEKVTNVSNPIDTSKYTEFDYKTKPMIGTEAENVRAAKERLYLLGYFTGAVDNKFDANLENAVVRFQADNELYPYGVLDITTQVRIENKFAKLEVLEDNQLTAAIEFFEKESK